MAAAPDARLADLPLLAPAERQQILTTWNQTGPTELWKLEDTHIFGTSFYLTAMASKVEGGFALDPNGGAGPDAPAPWRDVNNVWHNSFAFYNTDRPQEQYRADAAKFFEDTLGQPQGRVARAYLDGRGRQTIRQTGQ